MQGPPREGVQKSEKLACKWRSQGVPLGAGSCGVPALVSKGRLSLSDFMGAAERVKLRGLRYAII